MNELLTEGKKTKQKAVLPGNQVHQRGGAPCQIACHFLKLLTGDSLESFILQRPLGGPEPEEKRHSESRQV